MISYIYSKGKVVIHMAKCTGIIERIDDFGRVVIPKEIRRALRIRESDSFVISITENGVLFEKYDVNADIADALKPPLTTTATK